ncbi:hypothetical protein ACIBSW_40145 [Actinoplanes sp. NPDC049668]|uniref:hypothetical protein n=1 Tax=unclassified Actinoplanes TaxID=2626549 RepID=UPI0033B1A3D7
MTIRRLAIPLLVVVALAGCANGAASDDSAAAPGATSSAVPTEESASTAPTAGKKTLTGTITAGVEPGCLLLEDHLLVIKDTALESVAKVGATVTATGEAQPGMMTTCQQGTPFIVATIRAN